MEELTKMLNNIADSYYDFVLAVTQYAKRKPERLEKVLNYLKDNPNATSSDVVEFVSDQTDFYEDAAYMRVG